MVRYHFAAAAGLAALAYSVPLNINLGAYSPALVVGDGEISFGGNQDVTNLMSALEGAAVNAAGTAAGGKTATANGAATQPGAAAAAGAGGDNSAAASAPSDNAASAAPVSTTPAAQGTPASAPSTDAALQDQAAAISGIMGMGKEIAPRPGNTEFVKRDTTVAKRDLSGFDRALKYAEAALVKGPIISMGTGEKGSGVGLIVDNRPAAAAAANGAATQAGKTNGAATATVPNAARKRDLSESEAQPRRRTKITTMYIRRGLPAALSPVDLRNAQNVPLPDFTSRKVKRDEIMLPDEKRDRTLDSINLNVKDPQGVTMTFVETEERDGAEDE